MDLWAIDRPHLLDGIHRAGHWHLEVLAEAILATNGCNGLRGRPWLSGQTDGEKRWGKPGFSPWNMSLKTGFSPKNDGKKQAFHTMGFPVSSLKHCEMINWLTKLKFLASPNIGKTWKKQLLSLLSWQTELTFLYIFHLPGSDLAFLAAPKTL